MDLRLMVLLLFLCALAFTTTEGGIPKCCVKISLIPLKKLRRVETFYEQRNNGACEINALVLHVKGKKVCAHPKYKGMLRKLQQRKNRKNKKF